MKKANQIVIIDSGQVPEPSQAVDLYYMDDLASFGTVTGNLTSFNGVSGFRVELPNGSRGNPGSISYVSVGNNNLYQTKKPNEALPK